MRPRLSSEAKEFLSSSLTEMQANHLMNLVSSFEILGMRFSFTVVGRAADYMPYFIFAFSKMEEKGVGRLKVRYDLEREMARNLLAGTQEEVFDDEVVKNRRLPTYGRRR